MRYHQAIPLIVVICGNNHAEMVELKHAIKYQHLTPIGFIGRMLIRMAHATNHRLRRPRLYVVAIEWQRHASSRIGNNKR